MSHVVIVGAGFGGLSAAIELASSGLRVTVVEAADRPGGKAGVTMHDGVEIDTGPSVLTLPHVFDSVLRRAGTSLADEVELVDPGVFRYLFADGAVLDIHGSAEATLEAVRTSLGARDATELAVFLEYARGIWDAAAPNFVFGPAPTIGRIFSLGSRGLAAVTKVDGMRSMRGAIESRVRSPHLRTLLERYATYSGSDPRRAPATLSCIAHVELGLGFHGVRGGIQELVKVLARVGERVGVTFRYGARVASLLVERSRVLGVELQTGERIHARAVVATADPAHVAKDLLPGTAGRRLAVCREPSMSGYTTIVRAGRRDVASRPAHTVLFPADYEAEFRDIFDHDRPPLEPTLYLCAQEKAHDRAGWSDEEPLFVMANAPAEPRDRERDPDEWVALRERVQARLQWAGLVETRDTVVWERTPTDLAAAYPGSRGAIYGGSSNNKSAAFTRPSNRVAKLPGLYLAGGGAHPGGGMPLCVQSGRAAADCLRDDLGMPVRVARAKSQSGSLK